MHIYIYIYLTGDSEVITKYKKYKKTIMKRGLKWSMYFIQKNELNANG